MIVRKPSSNFTTPSLSSANSSLKAPSVFTEDCDADDEDAMSTDDHPSRNLSVAIPSVGAHGPYCPRRPNLSEILKNESSPPWTLAAFMAYLSNNHCLETLEFTMDAGRYKKHYAKMMSRAIEGGIPPAKDREYVQALWQRLVEAYIQANGSREVNLPASVRDPILNLKPNTLPPAPETLDPAVAKIYELMEDSVLVPFLNSVYPQTAHPTISSCPFDVSDDGMSTYSSQTYSSQAYSTRTYGDRTTAYARRNRTLRASSPPQTAVQPHAYSYTQPSQFRKSAPLPLPSPSKSRFSVKLTPSTSSPAAMRATSEIDGTTSASVGMTDDSGSVSSPIHDSPMTPPVSPPMSDISSSKRDSGMWKKLGRLSGMKSVKKKSHSNMKMDTQ